MLKIKVFILCLVSYSPLVVSTQPENRSQENVQGTDVSNQTSENPKNKLFTINGEQKYMIGHILNALLDAAMNKFCATSIVRYDEQNKRFIIEGDLRSISREALENIARDKFVYVPYYTMEKTEYSQGTYDKIGAIIVGTNDETLAIKLHLAALKGKLKEMKTQQDQQKYQEAPQAKEVLKKMASVQT